MIFDCQPCIVAVAIKMSYNCCYIPKQPSPPSQVFICVLPVSVHRSISGHPCVWSGTEPVVGDEWIFVFSSFKRLFTLFTRSRSASRAQTLSQRPVGRLAGFQPIRLSSDLSLVTCWTLKCCFFFSHWKVSDKLLPDSTEKESGNVKRLL